MKLFTAFTLCLSIALFAGVSSSSAAQYDPMVQQAQQVLKARGYDPGPPDGLWGKATERAVKYFQVDNALPVTGKLDDPTKAKLGVTGRERSIAEQPGTQRRLALLIGNASYPQGGSLRNPLNDVRDMDAMLKRVGFETLAYADCSQKRMKQVIDDFGQKLKGYEVGLFFYAGHGVQVNGNNYLIPVDAGLKAEEEVEYDCVRADRVLAKMEAAGSKTNIVILDACRDNPFERSWRRGTKGSGLATMNAPMGSLIAYATAPGRTALDGTEKNGVYTAALLDHIGVPNISVLEMFQRVRTSVIADTNNAQIPWESTSLTGNFYFASGGDPESQPPDRLAEERARLERERRELERLKLEIEKERIAAERRRLEAEKQKIESAGKPERAERESPKVAAIDPKDREIGRDRQYTAYANGVVYDSKTNTRE